MSFFEFCSIGRGVDGSDPNWKIPIRFLFYFKPSLSDCGVRRPLDLLDMLGSILLWRDFFPGRLNIYIYIQSTYQLKIYILSETIKIRYHFPTYFLWNYEVFCFLFTFQSICTISQLCDIDIIFAWRPIWKTTILFLSKPDHISCFT